MQPKLSRNLCRLLLIAIFTQKINTRDVLEFELLFKYFIVFISVLVTSKSHLVYTAYRKLLLSLVLLLSLGLLLSSSEVVGAVSRDA